MAEQRLESRSICCQSLFLNHLATLWPKWEEHPLANHQNIYFKGFFFCVCFKIRKWDEECMYMDSLSPLGVGSQTSLQLNYPLHVRSWLWDGVRDIQATSLKGKLQCSAGEAFCREHWENQVLITWWQGRLPSEFQGKFDLLVPSTTAKEATPTVEWCLDSFQFVGWRKI